MSAALDPASAEMFDISPGAYGNNPLGGNDGEGHPLNPATGLPYESNEVKLGDFGRVLAEFWADYDAADQAGVSRLYGGIHVAADDGPGRVIGAKVGVAAHAKAAGYFDGSVLDDFHCQVRLEPGGRVIRWNCLPGYRYKVEWAPTLTEADFRDLTEIETYGTGEASAIDSSPHASRRFYRVVRLEPLAP